ncbi:hypothetical protein [Rhodococcus xishaensis]|uniref:Uncharacterized protein n=1 Tax=Rhodococcus xishaensis TaxID=2487364 RepID=A0A438AWQ1_9NOCA|nr:hypothetical protein [Rhodococcus xishaensis]RVW03126.1 hypothetical protein EGT50_08685 [Rhodococcus xishaensis]
MVAYETENTGGEPVSANVSEADLVEQLTPAETDDEQDESTPPPTPLEVDPADAAEQRRSVPVDEDYPHA